jgi:hypothetical protein
MLVESLLPFVSTNSLQYALIYLILLVYCKRNTWSGNIGIFAGEPRVCGCGAEKDSSLSTAVMQLPKKLLACSLLRLGSPMAVTFTAVRHHLVIGGSAFLRKMALATARFHPSEMPPCAFLPSAGVPTLKFLPLC